jgi:hypothetical protein
MRSPALQRENGRSGSKIWFIIVLVLVRAIGLTLPALRSAFCSFVVYKDSHQCASPALAGRAGLPIEAPFDRKAKKNIVLINGTSHAIPSCDKYYQYIVCIPTPDCWWRRLCAGD